MMENYSFEGNKKQFILRREIQKILQDLKKMYAWILPLSVAVVLFGNAASLPQRKFFTHVVSISPEHVRCKNLFSQYAWRLLCNKDPA